VKKIFSIIILIIAVNSCIVVKYDNKSTEPPVVYDLVPQAQIAMSITLLRSDSGDMIGFLPVDWFFVDLGEDAPKETFTVAVNPDYTLSAVFSEINSNKNQLLEVAEQTYQTQLQKSGGKAKLIGNFKIVNVGRMQFMTYQVTTTAGAIVSNVAVFKSTYDN